MKKYALKTKFGEKIATTDAYDIFNAQVIFSKIKVLPLNQLLEIFIVEPIVS
jgi:hypothetical protein